MNKRYQVFVSSTYLDLKKEREAVMRTLLEMQHFPAGMELFPAAFSKPQEVISRVIGDCDYYVLVVGGRYGSEIDDGHSYTRWEYQYAKQRGLPILTFLRENPDYIPDGCEKEPAESKQKLLEFRKELESLQCKKWTTTDGLGKDLAIALQDQIKKTPAVGWVRGNRVVNQESKSESRAKPMGIKAGEETVEIGFQLFGLKPHTFRNFPPERYDAEIKVGRTLKEIFSRVAPCLIPSGSQGAMRGAVESLLLDVVKSNQEWLPEGWSVTTTRIKDHDFNRIRIKLRDFGWIELDEESRVRGADPIWKLTRKGDEIMSLLV